jgi:hypothetical protein
VIRRILATVVLVLGLVPAITRGQRQPQTFFKDHIKLPDSEIQTIERGQVVTKVLESGDKKYGLLVFGAVYVDAPVARFAAAVKDIQGLQQNKVYLAVKEFSPNGAPPKLSDFDNMTLERKDIEELRTCKPGDCDIQIFNVAELQKRVNWEAKDRDDQVNRIVRQNIYQGMATYLKDGLKGLGSYRDRQQPLNLYEATRSMIDLSYYLPKDKAGGIYRHVAEYPQGKLAGAEDLFYWEKIDFGQEPTLRVNHVTLFPQGVGVVKFVAANKQLYASRYMRVALQMFYCVPDTQQSGKPGFFLIEMNDSRLPDFGALKLGVVRKVASGKAVDATRDTLQMYKKRLTGV